MLNIFLRPVVIHLRIRHELWFQQDGATWHAPNETMDVLQGMFSTNIISRRAALTWPPRSPDLNAPDYYLWGYLKERVNINRPENLENLNDNVWREIRPIRDEQCSCKSSFVNCCWRATPERYYIPQLVAINFQIPRFWWL